jgi:hypothetical protein
MLSMLISKAELARKLRVDRSAVAHWRRRGMPTASDGRVEIEHALDWIVANIETQVSGDGVSKGAARAAELRDVRKGSGNGADATSDVIALKPAQMRARRDQALAEKYERENLIAEGALVPIVVVLRELEAEYARIRSRLQALPNKLAPKVILCRTAAEAATVIRDEIDRVLEELSSGQASGERGASDPVVEDDGEVALWA